VIQPQRLAVVLGCLVACDQLTKAWAVSALSDGHVVEIFWTLQFNLGYNSGIAFSQGQGLGPLVGLIACVAVVFLVRSALAANSKLSGYGLLLIASGALGNVLDRIFRHGGFMRGSVVDFIDFQWFPIFNVADSCITVGAIALLLGVFLESREQEELVVVQHES
jgi:signal peptidase II